MRQNHVPFGLKEHQQFKMVMWDSFSACRGDELAFLQEKRKHSVIIRLPTSMEIAAFAQAEGSQPTLTTFLCVQGRNDEYGNETGNEAEM